MNLYSSEFKRHMEVFTFNHNNISKKGQGFWFRKKHELDTCTIHTKSYANGLGAL